MTSWLMKSDVASALSGAVFRYAYFFGEMAALQGAVISMLARMLPGKVSVNVGSLSVAQKNEIVVAILGVVSAAYHKRNLLAGGVAAVSVDALGDMLLST